MIKNFKKNNIIYFFIIEFSLLNSNLNSNINNLPFQVCWNKNRFYEYKNINKIIKLFINCLKKSNPSWKEYFMTNIRKIHL
jgi:hypothetical protein